MGEKQKHCKHALCTDLHGSLHLAEKVCAVAEAMKIPVQENSQKPTLNLTQFELFLWVL
jgi:hypothetical protein